MGRPRIEQLIKSYQQVLDNNASKKSKAWWDKYMKGVIRFRGVGIPLNRDLLSHWRQDNAIMEWTPREQMELALAFLNEPVAEDKLAGILYLQYFLVEQLPEELMLPAFNELFDQRLIFDWNICDWFCVRVLSTMIMHHGRISAEKISTWRDAEYVWQARSSVVPFVKLADRKE